jgi:hypothetical protein
MLPSGLPVHRPACDRNALAFGDWARGWPRRLVGDRARGPHNGSLNEIAPATINTLSHFTYSVHSSAYCETISVSPCSGLGSCLATTLPTPSRKVISRCGFWATNCSYNLRATLCRLACLRPASELGVSEAVMLRPIPRATINLVGGDVVCSIDSRRDANKRAVWPARHTLRQNLRA